MAWSLLGASLGQQAEGRARATGCGLTKAGWDRAVGALGGAEMVSWATEGIEVRGDPGGTAGMTSEALETCLGLPKLQYFTLLQDLEYRA